MKLLKLLNEMPSDAQIKTIKHKKWKYPDQVANWLHTNNFKQLGHGHFAEAWARPNSNKVVKFSTTQDTCYIKFARYAQKNPSKYYPKIHEFRKYKEDMEGETMFVSVIEKLQPLTRDNIKRLNDPLAVAWLLEVGGIELDGSIADKPVYDAIGINTDDIDWNDGWQIYDQLQDEHTAIAAKARDKNIPIRKAFYKAFKTLGEHCFADMHDGNIYYRPKDNTPVLMDPFV